MLMLSCRLGFGVCHQPDVKLGEILQAGIETRLTLLYYNSRLGESCMSSHTEELRYNETVSLWMTIYIYIYIYIFTNLISTSIHGTRKKHKKKNPARNKR